MKNKDKTKTINKIPCPSCGELGSLYKAYLDICKADLDICCADCAEEGKTNLAVELQRTCLNCNISFPIYYSTRKLINHINRYLEEVVVIDE